MEFETIQLWNDGTSETVMLRAVSGVGYARPAVLIVPGGAYGCVCHDWEGAPIAQRFSELGFQTFVLHYRVAPNAYPKPIQDGLRAMKLIRGNAAEWNVIPDNIAVCGFSAGGHLAGALGTLWRDISADNGDQFDSVCPRPDAMILSYAVLTGGVFAHKGSLINLMQADNLETINLFSLEMHVDVTTPPAYVWATQEDNLVPVENSILFSDAMRRHRRLCELHIFPQGAHGIQLGAGRRDIPSWPGEAVRFLRECCGFAE